MLWLLFCVICECFTKTHCKLFPASLFEIKFSESLKNRLCKLFSRFCVRCLHWIWDHIFCAGLSVGGASLLINFQNGVCVVLMPLCRYTINFSECWLFRRFSLALWTKLGNILALRWFYVKKMNGNKIEWRAITLIDILGQAVCTKISTVQTVKEILVWWW